MPDISSNRLAASTSPYLLQHRDNPVHWQPWDQSALDAARELDRPILLSIGYAACHWCHVMAHESFEDHDVAALMNRHFVNIKVDREERPDIDQIYMAALSAMGEQGGWPLTMVLTPDGRPFWGGTYFPKTPRYGRPGFTGVLQAVADAYRDRRSDIEDNAKRLTDHLQDTLAGSADETSMSPQSIRDFSTHVRDMYEPVVGGIRGAPKFPSAPFLEILWRSWKRDGDKAARDRFVETITAIALGGIYDHLGGGLARYSVDGQWLVPHFEKMLYDNAHFIRHCVWAHGETGNDLFRSRVAETIDWLDREMVTATGGLSASLDADSEGVEGKYYVWQRAEIMEILGNNAASFCATYDISDAGNWEGVNIPNLSGLRTDPAAASVVQSHADDRQHLLTARQQRVPPGRDTKILADWNGYMIRAMAEAGHHFNNDHWTERARTFFSAILSSSETGTRLHHSHDGSKGSGQGFATDYAAMINAALSLLTATGDNTYLEHARRLAARLRENHFDTESKRGYRFAECRATDMPVNPWNDNDEANPSATAQIIEALTRLSLATDDDGLRSHVDRIAASAAGRIVRGRYGQAGFVGAMDSAIAQKKLVIVGPGRAGDPLWNAARKTPDPRRLDIYYESGKAPVRFDAPGAYLCEGMSCSLPVNEPAALASLLDAKDSG
ncbi:thioredoxin domain-containing protein [Oricola sp.]|uniref:thioredoxin domain-containing protein n=1 Tax=Oricola sp. TaxID=1979950 RepID=UPI003BA92529